MRGVMLWIGANVVLVILVTVCYAIWRAVTGQNREFSGASAGGQGGLVPVGTLLFFVGSVLIANLALAIVLASRRR